jgi:hypothetical protein
MAVKVNDQVTAQYEEYISQMLLSLWKDSCNDVFMMELLQELFTVLSANTYISIPFQTRMFPILISSLSAETVSINPQVALTSLDLITSLIKYVSDPFPPVYTSDMFPKLMTLLLQVEDTGLLQNGQELLKVLVHRDFDGIRNIQIQDKSGLEILLDFIAKMLRPEESESSAIFLGELITKLIQKGGNYLVLLLPRLLTAVIYRLDNAKMPAFIETMVLIFCRLIETQCTAVISLLSEIQLNGYSGLELFVRSFCDCFPDLQGINTVKVGTLAMIMLLSSKDTRLYSITVKGDLIVNNSKRIVTRSQSRDTPDQYSLDIFPKKGLKLLLDEYQTQKESKMKGPKKQTDFSVFENDGYESEEYDTCSENEEVDPFGSWGNSS